MHSLCKRRYTDQRKQTGLKSVHIRGYSGPHFPAFGHFLRSDRHSFAVCKLDYYVHIYTRFRIYFLRKFLEMLLVIVYHARNQAVNTNQQLQYLQQYHVCNFYRILTISAAYIKRHSVTNNSLVFSSKDQ